MAKRFVPPNIARAVRKFKEQNPGLAERVDAQVGDRPDVYRPPRAVQTAHHEMAADQKQRAEARAEIPPSQGRTEAYTYFTTSPGENVLLYSAQRWVQIRLFLETAGPVDVSTRQDILPVGGGKGISLITNVEVSLTLNENDRLFIAANAVNRVSVVIEPIAWLEQIALLQAKALKSTQ